MDCDALSGWWNVMCGVDGSVECTCEWLPIML